MFYERAVITVATLAFDFRSGYVLLQRYNLFHSTQTQSGTSSMGTGCGGRGTCIIYQCPVLTFAQYSRKRGGMP